MYAIILSMIIKKLFILISILLVSNLSVLADYSDFYEGTIEYNWDKITQTERDQSISKVMAVIFSNDFVPKYPKKEFKNKYKEHLKDKYNIEHYYAATAGKTEFGNANIAAFYTSLFNSIYMYGIQYKNDLTKNYYYDALGHLRYIDIVYDNYPNYPYYSKQYKINGKFVSAIYFVSKDCQYVFDKKGVFKGLWLKNNFYDKNGKITMTRSNY